MISCWIAGFAAILATVSSDSPCNVRLTSSGSVCVCNSTYCDTVPNYEELQLGEYQLYSTSKAKLGFWSTKGRFSNNTISADVNVTLADISKTHQKISGFGGAFTDATGINILRLSEPAQEALMRSYFGQDGIQYSFGRVPFGGTDFSTEGYTYCDEEDDTLEAFALHKEDFEYKIPFIQKAVELRGSDNIKFVGSAWSAPKWMKTNQEYNGRGYLDEKYYNLWATYYLKSLDAYKANNIDFWGITTQNEPSSAMAGSTVQSNGFSISQMKNWTTQFIGPIIRNSSYAELKIILHDDQSLWLPLNKYALFEDKDVAKYTDGIGIHWYTNSFLPGFMLLFASSSKKELFRISTEACIDANTRDGGAVDLGSWTRAEQYINDILVDLEYDFIGWIDWNMALNETGGPNWVENETDAPIIVNGEADEFYKQPMFYALGHFSRFLISGSIRVDIESSSVDLKTVAFDRPDGKIAIILWNRSTSETSVTINVLGDVETLTVEASSINTLLYFR